MVHKHAETPKENTTRKMRPVVSQITRANTVADTDYVLKQVKEAEDVM
jgi:glycerol-3-phosphate cytidylyltransferase-like family protein